MDKHLWVRRLGQLHPFAATPPADIKAFVDIVIPLTLSVNDNYSLASFIDDYYLLPLHGLLILQKCRLCRSRPFNTRLPLGGLYPLSKAVEPDTLMMVHAFTSGSLGIVAGAELQTLCEQNTTLRFALLNSVCLAWEQMVEYADYRTNSPLQMRLAHLLLELSKVREQQVVVPYTHEQISFLLNTHRETVSSTISLFRRLGWLKTRKGSLQLVNLPALARAAEDDEFLRKLTI